MYGNPKKFIPAFVITLFVGVFIVVAVASAMGRGAILWIYLAYIVYIIACIHLGLKGVREYNASLLETEADKTLEFRQNLDVVDLIRKIIKKDKNVPFYSTDLTDELNKLLEQVCQNKEKTFWLNTEYKNRFNRILLDDLQNLLSSEKGRNDCIAILKLHENDV